MPTVALRAASGGEGGTRGSRHSEWRGGSTARDDPPQWITQRYAYPRPRQSRETGISVVRPAKGYTEGRRTALIHFEWNGRRVETSHCSGTSRHARECGTRRDQTPVGGRTQTTGVWMHAATLEIWASPRESRAHISRKWFPNVWEQCAQ